jgi:hypothetical protein
MTITPCGKFLAVSLPSMIDADLAEYKTMKITTHPFFIQGFATVEDGVPNLFWKHYSDEWWARCLEKRNRSV